MSPVLTICRSISAALDETKTRRVGANDQINESPVAASWGAFLGKIDQPPLMASPTDQRWDGDR